MEKYDVIIIGSGLGGLACGQILAKNGMKVCVLEQNKQAGGCLQTFRRGGVEFDTGFHYVGGLNEGESMHQLFQYLGLLDLPWHPLDPEGFDEVVIGDRSFLWANGYEQFADTLAQSFPGQRKNLLAFTDFLKEVGTHLYDSFANRASTYTTSLFAHSAYSYLQKTINDPLLQKVLSGTSLKMELHAGQLPLYVFAQIHSSYIQSAWRLRDGGQCIVDRLSQQIRERGGSIQTNARVTRLIEDQGNITQVEVNGEALYSARWIISSAHPASTLSLIGETKQLRRIYRNRITSLQNTQGMFTVNIRLKPNSIPYQNRNIYIHTENADLWKPVTGTSVSSLMIHFQVPPEGQTYASVIDLMTPMPWSEVEKWQGLPPGRRGEAYQALKAVWAEACIERALHQLPRLRESIEKIETSTPLTYQSYTLTPEGSAYGVRKDCNEPLLTILPVRSPIPNLLFTGQSLNLHGVLGVSVTAFLTCAEILGMDRLYREMTH